MQRESAQNVRPETIAGNAISAGCRTGSWRAWVTAGLLFATAGVGRADDTWRTWKSGAGTAIEAKLVSCDGKQATLEKKDGKQLIVNLSQLSVEDQAFLKQQAPQADNKPKGETSVKGLAAEPGVPSGKITCEADPKWSYLLYLPKDFNTGRSWAVCFVMDPGGGSEGTVERYRPAAERLGIILAVSCESRNDFPDGDLAMTAMVKDVCTRLPVLEKAAIASGMSGGSRMAYLLAEMEKCVGGVLACGSGAGVYIKEKAFRQAHLRSDLVVCSLMGTNDFNRREAVKSHKGFGKEARLIWFAGNHDWAAPELIDDGLAEVYGRILEHSKARAAESLRPEFARKQLAWAKEQVSNAPGVAHHWGEFLSKFPGDSTVQKEAAALVASLPNGPALVKAEKALQDFANKHFSDGDTKIDKDPNPSRVKEAEKVAASLEGFPQAELVKRMGEPVIPP